MEIEIRTPIKSIEKIEKNIKDNKGIFIGEVIQHDIIFDTKNADFFKNGNKIRLRLEDEKAEITYKKQNVSSEQISNREEINIIVDSSQKESIIDFFTELGYPICFQIRKKRRIWKVNHSIITIDNWPIIGHLMEIEGKEKEIKQISKELFPEYIFKNWSLKELFMNQIKYQKKSIQQLKDEYFKKNRFDLGRIELILK